MYQDNIDADAEDEVIAYFELFDSSGRPTACDCTLEYVFSDGRGILGHAFGSARIGDFRTTAVGRGAFERSAFIFLDTVEEGHLLEWRCDFAYVVTMRLTLSGEGPAAVEDATDFYRSC